MEDFSNKRVVTRAALAELFIKEFGTTDIAWPIEGASDSVGGQATWLNAFRLDVEDGAPIIGRIDQKFFYVIMRSRGAYWQPVTYEEPRIEVPTNGRPRVVGYVRVYVNPRGYVHTKSETTLMGTTLMVHPTSISREDVIPDDARLLGSSFFCTNPQRIEGTVEVEILHRDFPDDEPGAMKVREIAVMSDDGRALSITAKLLASEA